ncbi:unnamed protein product [Adineta steineri]|uniref:Condensation domain-containing protein n=1 Tax=Adineta steineri TaxID=433720 RepID=A0A819NAM5_9BILA|nr:unnamed protein product [Adineta steineri]CAF3992947.1 unnamed protein product [Adineta steineri]
MESRKTTFRRPIDDTEDLGTNISFYCDLEYENLTKDMICHALSLLRQHHPYFRLHVETIDGRIWLVEEEIGDIPLTWLENITESWEDELNSFANQSYDHTVSLTFLQCRYSIQGRYQIFGVINHIALDGLGFVKALHTLYSYLGEMTLSTNYKTVLPADRRAFINVLERNPIHQPPVFDFTHNYLSPQELDVGLNEIQSIVPSSQGQMIGLFKKFDPTTTMRLLNHAKTHSTTIQGMLSTAALITSIWIRKVRPELPVWTLNWCATNLRQSAQPPIDSEDCISASAPLAWEQEVKEHSLIWHLAQDASKLLHKHNSRNMGWHFLNAKKFNVPVKPPSIMTSFNGKAQFGTKYGKLRINDIRIMTAHYNLVPADASSHMNYISIYDGQMYLVTTYTYPGLSKEWGKRFHNGIIYILECYANDSNLTVNSILDILDKRDRDLHACLNSLLITSNPTIFSSLRRLIASVARIFVLPCFMILSSSLLCTVLRRKFFDI